MLNKLNEFLATMFIPDSVGTRPENTLQVAIAVLLIEVMQSDAECAFEEQAAILNILKDRFHLSDEEVVQLTERAQQASREANDFHQFTTLINHELALPEKIQIVEYLWQVVYADGKVSAHENHIMRKLVDLLHISLGDNVAAKERARSAALK
ncbi:MAG: TerB family tellurite resistance protein [Sideroxydans sp.]|nr:TerB family tellurite resistance protein [Sideroxydans sp.]